MRGRDECRGVERTEKRRGRDEEQGMEHMEKRRGRAEGGGMEQIERRRKLSRVDVVLSMDVVGEILKWLPVKDIQRYRCVSKSWCTLIDSDHFEDMHIVRANKHRFVTSKIVFHELNSKKIALYSLQRQRGAEKKRGGWVGRSLMMRYSTTSHPFTWLYWLHTPCHGLNLAFSDEHTFVFNPCTQDFVTLPKPVTKSIAQHYKRLHGKGSTVPGLGYHDNVATEMVGLGYDSYAQEHKVVRIFYSLLDYSWLDRFASKYGVRCEVLTLGSNGSGGTWRPAMDPPYPIRHCLPVYADGAIYWVIETLLCKTRRPPQAILAFDAREERFREVPLPPPLKNVRNILDHISLLPSSEGCLCLAHHINKEKVVLVDIWMLTDRCRGLWRKVCFVLIDPIKRNGRLLGAFPIAMTKDEVFLYNSRTLVSAYPNSSSCNTLIPEDTRKFRRFHVAFHEESLVSPRGRKGC